MLPNTLPFAFAAAAAPLDVPKQEILPAGRLSASYANMLLVHDHSYH